MSDSLFEQFEQTLACGGTAAAFDLLAHAFRQEKKYPLLFELRLM